MDCKHATALIETALDAGLIAAPPAQARGHLAACPHCRRLWQESSALEAGLRTLAAAPQPEIPAGLHRGIMAALAAGGPGRSHRYQRRPRFVGARLGLGIAAAVMLGIVAGWPLLEQKPADTPSEIFSIPFSFETLLGSLDPTPLIETPREDFKMLASSILSATGGLLAPSAAESGPEPSPTVKPTPS